MFFSFIIIFNCWGFCTITQSPHIPMMGTEPNQEAAKQFTPDYCWDVRQLPASQFRSHHRAEQPRTFWPQTRTKGQHVEVLGSLTRATLHREDATKSGEWSDFLKDNNAGTWIVMPLRNLTAGIVMRRLPARGHIARKHDIPITSVVQLSLVLNKRISFSIQKAFLYNHGKSTHDFPKYFDLKHCSMLFPRLCRTCGIPAIEVSSLSRYFPMGCRTIIAQPPS